MAKKSLNWRDPIELSSYPSTIKPVDAHANSFEAGFRTSAAGKPKSENPFHPTKEPSHHFAYNAGHTAHQMHSGQNKTAG